MERRMLGNAFVVGGSRGVPFVHQSGRMGC